jgi:hypothetical protein
MGLGKTTEIIGFLVLMRLVRLSWQDVELARRTKSESLHLPASSSLHQQLATAQCPSAGANKLNKYGLECPCVETSFLAKHKIHGRCGVSLILVPQHLMGVWKSEWIQILGYPSSQPLLELVVLHHSGSAKPFELTDKKRKGMLSEMSRDGPSPVYGVAREENNRYVILTTSHSFLSPTLSETFTVYVEFRPEPMLHPRTKRMHVFHPLVINYLIRDEFHSERTEGSATIKCFADPCIVNSNPVRWIYSGTPYEKSPNDLYWYIKYMEGPSWRHDDVLSKCTAAKLSSIGNAFEALPISSTQGFSIDKVKLLVSQFTDFVNELFIARDYTTMWFNEKVCCEIPPNVHFEVSLEQLPEWKSYVKAYENNERERFNEEDSKRTQAWIDKGRKGKKPEPLKYGASRTHQLRHIVSVPALGQLRRDWGGPGVLRLSQADFDAYGWWANVEKSPYFLQIERLYESSAKLQALRRFLVKTGEDQDVNGRPVRHILSSYFVECTVIIYAVSTSK